jgi:hypothetical protein
MIIYRPSGLEEIVERFVRCFGLTALLGLSLAQSPQPSIPTEPNIPTEAGLYLEGPDGFNSIPGQAATSKRSGSLLVSGATAGIKKRTENVQLPGQHAQTVVNGKPVFYFIPARQGGEAGVNATDLILIQLEQKKQGRQFEVGAQRLWRRSSGISRSHQIEILRTEEKPGTYKVTPAAPLNQGEYALYLPQSHGAGPAVYDFSVQAAGAVAKELLDAKTAYIQNDAWHSSTGEQFSAALSKWGRFKVTDNHDEADLVFHLTGSIEESTTLEVTDARTGRKLWSGKPGKPRQLVDELRKEVANRERGLGEVRR